MKPALKEVELCAAKGLEGKAGFFISGEPCAQQVVAAKKYLYIDNTKQRAFSFLLGFSVCLF